MICPSLLNIGLRSLASTLIALFYNNSQIQCHKKLAAVLRLYATKKWAAVFRCAVPKSFQVETINQRKIKCNKIQQFFACFFGFQTVPKSEHKPVRITQCFQILDIGIFGTHIKHSYFSVFRFQTVSETWKFKRVPLASKWLPNWNRLFCFVLTLPYLVSLNK